MIPQLDIYYKGAVATLEEPVCPFLILDVRPQNEFSIGHLITAVCYPHNKLSKAFNWEIAEMLHYKNHPDWIIVICDEKENLSPGVATTLIQRGYDNSFVLSGGLKLADDKIGHPLITASESRIIPPKTAEFLYEIVSSSLKPSNNSLQWWLSKKTVSVDSRSKLPAICDSTLMLSTTSSLLKEDKEDRHYNNGEQSNNHDG